MATNYTTLAIDYLKSIIPSVPPMSRLAIEQIVMELDKAVKFEMPINGRLFDPGKALEGFTGEILHLPYRTIALEYPYDDFCNIGPNEVPSTKRISLCLERTKDDTDFFGYIGGKVSPTDEFVIVIPIFLLDHVVTGQGINMWCIPPWGVLIPKGLSPLSEAEREIAIANLKDAKAAGGLTVDGEAYFGFYQRDNLTLLPEAAQDMIDTYGIEVAQASALNDSSDEVVALIELLTALSCSNVSCVDRPAPAKLNKKRARSGKPPLYDYKEVVVRVGPAGSSRASADFGGDRKGPREHLRRGHIRRLGDGRRIWIQPMVVGKGGATAQPPRYKVKK